MITMSRRQLMAGAAGLSLAPLCRVPATAADAAKSDSKDVTKILAHYLVSARYEDLPENVRKAGVRTLLNYVGVAIGGSHHETVDIAVAALAPFSGPPQASLFGRAERLDIMNAAFINGVSSHIFDYDDTHLKTIIHPGGPVISAILALAEMKPVNGRDLLNALVLGVETECRIGNAVYPNHYDVGWHITGTAGVFGAAAAAGRLMGLSEQQMVWALGLAASQPVGLRESFGSMNKSFNPGRATADGLFAAILASKNYTSSDGMIEAKRGWANTISTKQDYREITGELGQRYEAALNTYKPFACGIVLHPAIDAAIQLRNENSLTAAQVKSIDMKVNPLVLELTGKKTPKAGGQVQRLPRGRCGPDRRRWGREAVFRPRGARWRDHRAARQGQSGDRCGDQAGTGRDVDHAHRWPRADQADRACDRQPGAADERCRSRAQVQGSRRRHHSPAADRDRDGALLDCRKPGQRRRHRRGRPQGGLSGSAARRFRR
jgi:2-methylcitrate dehydratase PrpD